MTAYDNVEGGGKSPSIGMKPSKKFANGTVHENGSGKFEIVARYMENNIIMLKYKWLTGEFEGQTETNKEVNVNASIWKFKKVRGLVGNTKETSTNTPNEDLFDKIELIESYVHEAYDGRDLLQDKVIDIHNTVLSNHDDIKEILTAIEAITSDRDAAYQRIARLEEQVKDKNESINRLASLIEKQQSQIDLLLHQYDLASKLIDKI